MAQAATKSETQADEAEAVAAIDAKPVIIDPKQVCINSAGQVFRNVLIRMPEGAISDDLRDPKIFVKVQRSAQVALIKLDNLLILGFDESWAVRALVSNATSTEAYLAFEKVFAFREQGQALYSDGEKEVFWDGASYGVRRVVDKVRIINHGFTLERLAIDALRDSYAKVA